MLKTRLVLLVLLLVAAPLSAAGSRSSESALGNSGELFSLESGTFAELFDGGKSQPELAGDTPVLALDIELPGQPRQRLLVPTSDGAGVDQQSWVIYDKREALLNVVWQEAASDGANRVLLAHFKDGEWSEVFEIFVGQPGVLPAMALTRDAFDIAISEEESILAQRQILHLAWRGEAEGKSTVFYSPVIFVEGRYVGWQETFDLNTLWAAYRKSAQGGPPTLPDGLRKSLSLEVASDQRSVLIAFADPEIAAVAVCKIGILPLELAYLSDNIRKEVLMRAAEFDPQDLTSFADNMRLEIIGMGARFGFHSTVVTYVADHVDRRIREEGGQYAPADLPHLADDLHAYTVDITASLLGVEVTTAEDGEIVEIDVGDLVGNPTSGPAQLLDLRLASERSAPAMIGDRPAAIYPAADGRGMLIAWQDLEQDLLLYVESETEGWSEVRQVSMTGLSPERADQLLRQRAQ